MVKDISEWLSLHLICLSLRLNGRSSRAPYYTSLSSYFFSCIITSQSDPQTQPPCSCSSWRTPTRLPIQVYLHTRTGRPWSEPFRLFQLNTSCIFLSAVLLSWQRGRLAAVRTSRRVHSQQSRGRNKLRQQQQWVLLLRSPIRAYRGRPLANFLVYLLICELLICTCVR